ncbi:MAG: putative quinol monooxygenase [Gemmatimonas sp.]
MHLVIIYCRVKSNCRPAFLRSAASLCETSRGEPGNVAYGYFEDPTRPGRFAFVEEWASRQDIDRHLAQPHTQAFLNAALDMLFEPPSMRIIEAGKVEPLELRVSQ